MSKQAMDVRDLTQKRLDVHQQRWRTLQVPLSSLDLLHLNDAEKGDGRTGSGTNGETASGGATVAACVSGDRGAMKVLRRAAAHRYRNWMHRWEDDLSTRSTDRIVRPFEMGLEWIKRWPVQLERAQETDFEYVARLNEKIIAEGHKFFAYDVPPSYVLKAGQLAGVRFARGHAVPGEQSRQGLVVSGAGPQSSGGSAALELETSATECPLRRASEAGYFGPALELAVS